MNIVKKFINPMPYDLFNYMYTFNKNKLPTIKKYNTTTVL